MQRRGYFFTIDGLLAATVLLSAMFLFTSFGQIQRPVIPLNFAAADVLASLGELSFAELNSTAGSIVAGASTEINTNQTVLAVIGELWHNGDVDVAESLTRLVLDDRVPAGYGIGLWLDDDQIYARDSPAPISRASARTLISGFLTATPLKGYSSRVGATTVRRQTTSVIPFNTQGSGWLGSQQSAGRHTLAKWINLSTNWTVDNASLAVSAYLQSTGDDWKILNMNNGSCNITRDQTGHQGNGYYQIYDVKSCLVIGMNKFTSETRNTGSRSKINPGMALRVDYHETVPVQNLTPRVSERYYFDNASSIPGAAGKSGVWQVLPFHVPYDATNVSVFLQITGRGITDMTTGGNFQSWTGSNKNKKDYDYIMFINENVPFASDASPSYNKTYNYTNAQLSSKIRNGTNFVLVYFNNYGDTAWGDNPVSIYAEPTVDINRSSFLELNYTRVVPPFTYVEVGLVKQVGPPDALSKTGNFSFPSGVLMSRVFGHIAQRDVYRVTVSANDYNPPTTTVFTSPIEPAVPEEIAIPGNVLSISSTAKNYVKFADQDSLNIIENSSINYRFWVPTSVGFGAVYVNASDAEADALARLTRQMQPYVTAVTLGYETKNSTAVPNLWGPAIAEVRVWK
ncbi:MAG TPA: hypothetical protein VLJ21_03005 [Candidatus Binatia bacterium]|nr:hypothetical protein [Candidatus Binatia bacterium]